MYFVRHDTRFAFRQPDKGGTWVGSLWVELPPSAPHDDGVNWYSGTHFQASRLGGLTCTECKYRAGLIQ
jgi:hypothetical protein